MTDQSNPQTTQTEKTTPASTPVNTKELGLFATGGALAGVGISHIGGGIALASATTAAVVGMLPVIAAGAAVGAAAYGIKKGMIKLPTSSVMTSKATTTK